MVHIPFSLCIKLLRDVSAAATLKKICMSLEYCQSVGIYLFVNVPAVCYILG